MILGVARCFAVVFIWSVSVSAEGSIERFLNILKDKSRAVELKRFEVATGNDKVDAVFGDEFPELKISNAFIFEYRGGKRILGDELLMWGSKSWKFPQQDVSLLIKYPENENKTSTMYYMTHFQAFISQDAKESHGYLTTGGYGHPSMELEFLASSANYLSYDIRIFGIRSDLVRNHTEVFGKNKDS